MAKKSTNEPITIPLQFGDPYVAHKEFLDCLRREDIPNAMAFLDAGTPINKTSNRRNTTDCLSYAIQQRNIDLLCELLRRGADPAIRNTTNETPVEVLIREAGEQEDNSHENLYVKILCYLLANGGNTRLAQTKYLSESCNAEAYFRKQKALEEHPLIKEAQAKLAEEEQHQLTVSQPKEAVDWPLTVEVTVEDINKAYPFARKLVSLHQGPEREATLKKLIGLGLPTEPPEGNSLSLLALAIENKNQRLAKLLLPKSDVNWQGGTGETALSKAILHRNEKMVKDIVRRGPTLDNIIKRPGGEGRRIMHELYCAKGPTTKADQSLDQEAAVRITHTIMDWYIRLNEKTLEEQGYGIANPLNTIAHPKYRLKPPLYYAVQLLKKEDIEILENEYGADVEALQLNGKEKFRYKTAEAYVKSKATAAEKDMAR